MNGLFCFWPLYRNFPPALPRPKDWQPRQGLLGKSSSGAVLSRSGCEIVYCVILQANAIRFATSQVVAG